MKKLGLAIIIALSTAGSAFACDSISATIFSCTTKGGKVAEVCDTNGSVKYTFGKPGKVIKRPYSMVDGFLQGGGGSVTLTDGNWSYVPLWEYGGKGAIESAEIGLYRDGKPRGAVTCSMAHEVLAEGLHFWQVKDE